MSWKEYDELWKRRKDTSRSLEAYDPEQQVVVQRDMADVITTAKKAAECREKQKEKYSGGQKTGTGKRTTPEYACGAPYGRREDVVTGLPDANILQKKPETEKRERYGKGER